MRLPTRSTASCGGGRRLAPPAADPLRHVADDVRAFYQEAVASQPGPDAPTHAALADWIFEKTVFGKVLVRIGEQIAEVAIHASWSCTDT